MIYYSVNSAIVVLSIIGLIIEGFKYGFLINTGASIVTSFLIWKFPNLNSYLGFLN